MQSSISNATVPMGPIAVDAAALAPASAGKMSRKKKILIGLGITAGTVLLAYFSKDIASKVFRVKNEKVLSGLGKVKSGMAKPFAWLRGSSGGAKTSSPAAAPQANVSRTPVESPVAAGSGNPHVKMEQVKVDPLANQAGGSYSVKQVNAGETGHAGMNRQTCRKTSTS